MYTRSLGIVILAALLTLLPAAQVLANVEIHPRITVTEEYTDNRSLAADNEEEDWITTISPGISLSYDGRSVDVLVDYSLQYKFYANNSDDNLDDFEDVQRATATANFFSGRPFTVAITESISRETLDERENSTPENELENKSTVYRTSVNPQYRLQLTESFSLVFGYTYDRTDYADDLGNDSEEHSGRFSLVKQLSTNTEISANYTYKVHQSDDDADYDEQTYSLGVNHQLGPRTRINLEGGFTTIEYDDGDNEQTTNWLVDVSYRLSAPITLSLIFSQDFSNSAVNGLTESRDASLILDYEKESYTGSAEIYWEQSDYVRLSREDESYGTRFSLNIPLARNLSSNYSAEYERAEYTDTTNEEVDHYSLGTGLEYEFSRFLASIGYRYRYNDSDINNNDYTENRVTLSLSLRF